MSKDMSSALARVRDSSAVLNQLCDEAAESVRSLEEYLAKECSVGIEAFVEVRSVSDEYHSESMLLCYQRWGSGFRVLLEWEDSQSPGSTCKPWAECRREDKLESLPLLIDLIEAIENEINSRVQKARKAIAEIKKLTSVTTKAGGQNATK